MRGIDWISALHDSLLVHILSYLSTKMAVGTSGLSKSWRNVWASVPVLEFDFAHFWSEDIFSRTKYETYVSEHSECHGNFVGLIDAVLASRQGQQIDRFTLVWKYQVKNYHYHGHPVRRWISLILQQSPQVLSIYVQPSVADVEVPDMAFTCSSLEEMKLQVDNRSPEVLEPKLVNLPSLRRLNLGYFTIETDFMSKLLLGCPKLEELELYACGLNLSQISCNNLKSLVFDGCCNFAEIRVSIPSLQYLKVTVVSSQTAGFVFENMSVATALDKDRLDDLDGSDEFELLKLREVVSEHGNCQLIESKEGHIYESLNELQKLLLRYMERFEKMLMELPASEVEEDDDDNGGGGGGIDGSSGGDDVDAGGDGVCGGGHDVGGEAW